MTPRTLSLRELNRATLSRQMLLEREAIPVSEAVERLVAVQAQIPNPPYIGLWTRLHDFHRDTLTQLMESRQIVRAAMMRSTLHLITAEDHQRFRPVIEPALIRALGAFFGKRGKGLDIETLVETARPFLEAQPRSTGELRERLLTVAPDRDGDALAYAVRSYLPIVQVPPGGTWGSGSAATYTTAEVWLGNTTAAADLAALFRRYLAGYGPATIMDFQTWTGMTGLKSALEPLKSDFVIYQDEQGRELFDLPDAPLTPADTPAPLRFIPEYDNLLIAQADRTRIISEADRPKVFLSAGRVLGTILVDGFVRGTWKISRQRKAAELVISPFGPISDDDRAALLAEAEPLLRFVEDSAESYSVRFDA